MAERKHVVVLGCGAAGASIVHAIHRYFNVTVIPGDASAGSTMSNQKWKHSGLLYLGREFAMNMWQAYSSMDPVLEVPFTMKPRARFLAMRHDTIQQMVDKWHRWNALSWGMNVVPLATHEYRFAGELGETKAVGGLSTPDCVMDFPGLVRNLRHASQIDPSRAPVYIDGASATRLDVTGGRVTGVYYSVGAQTDQHVQCDYCVVAAGAWSARFIERSGGNQLPILLRKCIVLTYAHEVVPCLTVCLDLREGDGAVGALVPFKG